MTLNPMTLKSQLRLELEKCLTVIRLDPFVIFYILFPVVDLIYFQCNRFVRTWGEAQVSIDYYYYYYICELCVWI